MSTGLKRVLVVTGSGISAESGIPTFRGQGGYWRNLDPTKLATMEAFEKDPALIWQWYRERRDLIRRSQPNAAHNALVQLAIDSHEFLLLTQNVDDLHTQAQWEGRRLQATQIVQIHGDIFVTRCLRCDFKTVEREKDAPGVPKCPNCDSRLRPGVIWFHEELNGHEMERVEHFLGNGPCDLVLVIGTTALFDYIVNWTLAAKRQGGLLIEVNPEETAISRFADETLRLPAALALPELVRRWLVREAPN